MSSVTWTLRVYNGTDEEIGWVTADPYEYEITHPDGTDIVRNGENLDVAGIFGGSQKPYEIGFTTVAGDSTRTADFLEFDSPKDHLEYVRDRIDRSVSDVAFTLKDE